MLSPIFRKKSLFSCLVLLIGLTGLTACQAGLTWYAESPAALPDHTVRTGFSGESLTKLSGVLHAYIPGSEIYVEASDSSEGALWFYDDELRAIAIHTPGEDSLRVHRWSDPEAAYFRLSIPGADSAAWEQGRLSPIASDWKDKTLLFCGTSIPAGGYPEIVGERLQARVVNLSVPRSILRAYRLDGSDLGENGFYAFTQTIAEKRKQYGEEAVPYSYESLLLPYLDGRQPLPDLFVIDYASDYVYDEPNSPLPVNRDLVGKIGPDPLTWSLGIDCNRCTYGGALSFVVSLIRKANPQARIVLVEFMSQTARPYMVEAQHAMAEALNLPICPVSEALNWTANPQKGSARYFNAKYSPDFTTQTNVSRLKLYCPDGLHPQLNQTRNAYGYPESNYALAQLVADFLSALPE